MKMKEQLQKQQDEEFQKDLSFAQWHDFFSKEPTSKELNDMEDEACKNKPQNNPYYQPLQGA